MIEEEAEKYDDEIHICPISFVEFMSIYLGSKQNGMIFPNYIIMSFWTNTFWIFKTMRKSNKV